jgi:hypothetical protein
MNETLGTKKTVKLHLENALPKKIDEEKDQDNKDKEFVNNIKHFFQMSKYDNAHKYKNSFVVNMFYNGERKDVLVGISYTPTYYNEDLVGSFFELFIDDTSVAAINTAYRYVKGMSYTSTLVTDTVIINKNYTKETVYEVVSRIVKAIKESNMCNKDSELILFGQDYR